MSIWVALLYLAIEIVLVAALAARPAGARMGFLLTLLSLAVPVWAHAGPFLLTLLALGFAWTCMRAWDLVHGPSGTHFLQRLAHLLVLLDARKLWRVPRHIDVPAALRLLVSLIQIVAAVSVARAGEAYTGWPHYALRWSGGALLMFAGLEALASTIASLLALSGWATHVLHDAPHRSLTLAEFWGERWNRVVSRLLDERVFRPLKRRPWLALSASFGLSGALHAYMIGVGLGATAGLCWGAFFMAQPPLIAVERRLKVRRWPAAAAWSWTAGTLLALSPLLTEPGLRLFI